MIVSRAGKSVKNLRSIPRRNGPDASSACCRSGIRRHRGTGGHEHPLQIRAQEHEDAFPRPLGTSGLKADARAPPRMCCRQKAADAGDAAGQAVDQPDPGAQDQAAEDIVSDAQREEILHGVMLLLKSRPPEIAANQP